MTTINEIFLYQLSPTNPMMQRGFLCGTEYEIESIKTQHVTEKGINCVVEPDHSLRNNGLEFKTPAVSFDGSLELFDAIHKNIVLGANPYSDRTSIHVHVNMLPMHVDEVRQFVLAYALFEPLFFNFVGPVREGSIFCVPLSYTYLPSIYKSPIDVMWQRWQKYTAFNLCPLATGKDGSHGLGTIEFRHLYGTGDKDVYVTWLSAIRDLYTFIEQTSGWNIIRDIERGLTPQDMLAKIIPTFYKLYKERVNNMCKNSLLDVKLSTGGLTQ